jgi:thiol:disulfide interchange protein
MKQVFVFSLILLSSFVNAQIEKPVHWKFSLEPLQENDYNLVFTATIDAPWHMYASDIPEGGPIATSFNYADSTVFRFAGKLQQLSKQTIKFDPNFNMKIGMFSQKAIFKQKIQIISSNKKSVKGFVEFMACNDRTCLAPEEIPYSFDLPAMKAVMETTKTKDVTENAQTIKDTAIAQPVSEKPEKSNTEIPQIKEPEKPVESLWSFFLTNFLVGLGGLLTPCVYPMIPMTVSFFMRGQERKRRSIVNAFIFGISIVLIYSSLGLIVTLTGAGSNFFNTLSTHWIPNTLFFLLFLIFAASFFGMFEIVLPGSLTNKIDQQAEKGGFLAPFFMALTLVVVSFSCTGPIVSSLLIEASKGAIIRPTIGMFAYSLAFALPFTLFAIFPRLLSSLPKSGGWLNAVKVFFGFILLAWGMKFLSSIDQGYHLNLFTREVYIGIWIVLFSLLGFYLLGKIKFAHDSDVPYIGVPRLFFIVVVFSFVLYLIPGLFGAPLTRISGWLPPKTTQAFDLTLTNSDNTNTISSPNALCSSPKYANILKIPYGIQGYFDYEEGLACAKKQHKPLLIDFNGHFCTNCKLMENTVWPDNRILEKLKNNFVMVSLYIDDRTELPVKDQLKSSDGKLLNTLGKKNANFQMTRFNSNSQPFYIVLDDNGKVMNKPMGLDLNAENFIKFLDEGIANFKK